MPELPTDVRAGATWTSSGVRQDLLTGAEQEWSWSATARLPEDETLVAQGCLTVLGTLATEGTETSETNTWCPGQGVIAPTSAESPLPPMDLGDDLDWEPNAWQVLSEQLTPPPPLSWDTTTPPVGTDDLTVFATSAGDLILSRLPQRWSQAHPGGEITTLTRRGELLMSTTTSPAVVAHDLEGRPRWRHPLGETVPVVPAFDGDRVLVQDAVSTLTALDATTGELLWETALDEAPTASPVWCGEVAVATTAQGVTGLDPADGSQLWETALPERPTGLACVAGHLVVLGLSAVELIDSDGERLGLTPLPSDTIRAPLVLEETLVVRTAQGLRGYTVSSEGIVPRWHRRGEFLDAATDGGVVAAVTRSRLETYDSSGTPIGSWQVQRIPTEGGIRLGVTSSGVLGLGPDQVLRGIRCSRP